MRLRCLNSLFQPQTLNAPQVSIAVQRRGQDVWLPLLTPDGKEAGGRIQVHPTPPSQFKNKYSAEMWSGSEEGSHLRLIEFCITEL